MTAARLFSLVVLVCDDYFALVQHSGSPEVRRFFRIARFLPIEMQMTLCNRSCGSPKDLITKASSEAALRDLAWRLYLEQQL